MLNPTFLKNKIKRQINQNGQKFVFYKYEEDQFHQKSDEPSEEIEVLGIYHTTNNYVNVNTKDGASISKKLQPMILVLYEDGKKINKEDKVVISGKEYVVNDKNNINSFDVAFDISLTLREYGLED